MFCLKIIVIKYVKTTNVVFLFEGGQNQPDLNRCHVTPLVDVALKQEDWVFQKEKMSELL